MSADAGITTKVAEVKDMTRMERTGAHSHIRGKEDTLNVL